MCQNFLQLLSVMNLLLSETGSVITSRKTGSHVVEVSKDGYSP